MDHEYDQERKHSPAANTSHNDAVEPGQSSRSHLLRRPEHPIASGLVQRKGGSGGDEAAVHEAAARGVATASSQLPHADVIQRAFGRHDISSVQAHTGRDAAASAGAMGAQAYATGNHVVLGGGTDLHTVAHEAAHVVQQRHGVHLKGGVGAEGDVYERHADAVADAVVQGKSAEGLLDGMVGGGTAGGTASVQHKRYIRGCKSDADFNKDMEYLRKQSSLHDGRIDDEINNWLEGSGWSSTTRYNEGQLHYYSPVGLVLEISEDKKVLGNFKGDGNTSTLKPHKLQWWMAIEAVRKDLNTANHMLWQNQPLRDTQVTNKDQGQALIANLKTVLKNAQPGEKQATIHIMQDQGTKLLQAFYEAPQSSNSSAQNERIMKSGLNPSDMNKAEQAILDADNQVLKIPPSTEIKYTESVVNATASDIEGTYYNKKQGNYPAVDARLNTDPQWLENRQQLAATHQNGKCLFAIDNGSLTDG